MSDDGDCSSEGEKSKASGDLELQSSKNDCSVGSEDNNNIESDSGEIINNESMVTVLLLYAFLFFIYFCEIDCVALCICRHKLYI
jgi:hypothetical protein